MARAQRKELTKEGSESRRRLKISTICETPPCGLRDRSSPSVLWPPGRKQIICFVLAEAGDL